MNRKRWTHLMILIVTVAVAAAAMAVLTGTARADGVTQPQLVAHGWTCVPFLPANRTSCFDPGVGRPFPNNPEPAPTYHFVAFDLTSGAFLYTGLLIRQDLYHGQPCSSTGARYDFRGLIGYYECVHR